MSKSYKTVIKDFATDSFIEKKSEFISYVKRIEDEDEAKAFIKEISTKHADATHNCYAYILKGTEVARFSDDGEPGGTAGMPMLEVLKREGVSGVCVVVTRYFGGILLGAGGLVRAYSHSAKIAVEGANIIRMSPCTVLRVVCDYGFYGRLSTLVPEFGGIIENTEFGENVTMEFRLQSKDADSFTAALTEASFGRVSAEKIGEKFDSV